MLPQKIVKIRYLRLTKVDFPPSEVQQMSSILTELLLGGIEIFIWKGIKFIK